MLRALIRIGDFADACAVLEQALHVMRESHSVTGEAFVQQLLGELAEASAHPAMARQRYEAADEILSRIGSPHFTGRAEELHSLAAAIVADSTTTVPTVVAIDGMAGVGKSALAIHLAHRLASQFPDGQIFLSLHAHDPYDEPIDQVSKARRRGGLPAAL